MHALGVLTLKQSQTRTFNTYIFVLKGQLGSRSCTSGRLATRYCHRSSYGRQNGQEEIL